MEEISLREIVEMLLKNKKLICLIIIACLIIGPLGAILLNGSAGSAVAVVAVDFPGIEEGINPDGSLFDINKIIAPAVIQDALDKLSGEIDADASAIRNSISVNPVVPGDTAAAVENAIKAGKTYTFFPSRFTVRFNIGKKLGISRSQGAELLETIIVSYAEYFSRQYSEAAFLSDTVEEMDFTERDYYEAADVLEDKIGLIVEYLGSRQAEAQDFRTSGTGMSFLDMQAAIRLLSSIDMENARSLISGYNLTKNSEKLVAAYRFKIKMLELDKAYKDNAAEAAVEMMDKYERAQNLLVLPSQMDGGYSVPEGSSYYEKLAETATLARTEAQNIAEKIAFYNREIQTFVDDNISAELKAAAAAEVEAGLLRIKGELAGWVNTINEAVREFYNIKYGRFISNISGVNTESALDLKMILAVSLLIGIILGTFLALFIEYWKKGGKQEALTADAGKPVPLKEEKPVTVQEKR